MSWSYRWTEDIFHLMEDAPPLMPVFRSRMQGEVVALVLAAPDIEYSLTEIARRLGVALSSVQREVNRLVLAGVFRERRVGNTRLISADPTSPGHGPLRALAERYFGVPAVLGEEFAAVSGIKELYVFGSWVVRLGGAPGPPPADIDVLVVGNANRDDLYDAALRAERRLGRPVNVTTRTTESWTSQRDGFVRQVRNGPLLRIDHHGGEQVA